MSTGDLAVSLTLKLNDQGSAAAARALKVIDRSLKEVETTAKTTGAAAVSAFKKLADSREVLGIRSEKAIQNEIRQTEAAYKRMVSSGQAGARELARAQDAMRGKVAALRQEMEGVSKASAGMPRALQVAMGAGAGFMAGRAVLAGPVSQTMGYDLALRHVSNTAFAGQSLGDRRAGMYRLNSDVMGAVRHGGGTREGALDTLSDIYGSGVYKSSAAATAALNAAVFAATATGSDSRQMASIGIRARQNFGISEQRAYEIAHSSGKEGGFELKDMSKHLGSQMALAQGMTGMTGERSYASLLALNQAAVTTAGTKDEAALNVSNLLAKINSQDTANDAKKLGIDLRGTLAAAAGKGVNPIDAFMNLTEQIAAKDPRMKGLKKQLAAAPDSEKGALIEAQMGILKGSAIGKIVQDRQALLALLGGLNNRETMHEQIGKTLNSNGVVAGDHAFVAESPLYQEQKLAAESANAMQEAMNKVNPLLGGMAEGLAGVMQEWPVLSAALVGGGTAVTALAASATAASFALAVLTKTAGGSVLPGLPDSGRGGSKGPGFKIPGGVKAAGLATLPLAAMWGVSEWAGDTSNDAGRTGALTSLSGLLREITGDPTGKSKAAYQAKRGELDGSAETPFVIENKIVLDGSVVAESVNRYNSRQAARK